MALKQKDYDVTGAARKLKITPSAVSQHITKGHIKQVYRSHLGSAGRMVITESALQEFIWSDFYTLASLHKSEEVE